MPVELNYRDGKFRFIFEIAKSEESALKDAVKIEFESSVPAEYKGKKRAGVNLTVYANISKFIDMFLTLRDYGYGNRKEFVYVFPEEKKSEDGKYLYVYSHPAREEFVIFKGINAITSDAGLAYIDTGNYTFLLLMTYIRSFIRRLPALVYSPSEEIIFIYNRQDRTLAIEFTGRKQRVVYLDPEQVELWIEMREMINRTGKVFTHSFSSDRRVYIDKDTKEFIVYEKAYDYSLFDRVGYLLSI